MHEFRKREAAVIGGGPAGLIAAEILATAGLSVTIYDHMPSLGRKFLMAGRGGLNLTHAEPLPGFLARYGEAEDWLTPFITGFPPQALIDWCHGLGQATFIGSSRRVFPVAMKASPLLRAWLHRLGELGVATRLRHHWTGWNDGLLCFNTPRGPVRVSADATILALGGASWPRLGSDAAWTSILADDVAGFRPANCGMLTEWSDLFRQRFAGQPLKRIALAFAGRSVRGEAMVTASGLEGGAIYALSGPLRDAIAAQGEAVLTLDLRPDIDQERLAALLGGPRGSQSLANVLRKKAGLPPVAIGLVQEAWRKGEGDLVALIKALPVRLTGVAPIERAISSAGGLRRNAFDQRLMLLGRPGVFAAGEMLDWEAPTGGYLLQACFATGVAAAQGAMAWLRSRIADTR